MNYKYKGLNIEYDIKGKGNPIILLHGWGTSKKTFHHLVEEIKSGYEVHTIDLIGFGKSDEPYKPMTLNDYVYFLRDYILRNNLNNPILLGHSFGGRIIIKYASIYEDIDKIILVDSAGIKKRLNIKTKYKIYRYKFLKKWFKLINNKSKYQKLINQSGSNDYKNATDIMKRTLSLVINEDLKKYIKKIKQETLIIWGKDDKVTPYKDALYMKKHIKNSGLVTIENTGHFPYLENKNYFHIIMKDYLKVENDIY